MRSPRKGHSLPRRRDGLDARQSGCLEIVLLGMGLPANDSRR
jgi:hypothetical protein